MTISTPLPNAVVIHFLIAFQMAGLLSEIAALINKKQFFLKCIILFSGNQHIGLNIHGNKISENLKQKNS